MTKGILDIGSILLFCFIISCNWVSNNSETRISNSNNLDKDSALLSVVSIFENSDSILLIRNDQTVGRGGILVDGVLDYEKVRDVRLVATTGRDSLVSLFSRHTQNELPEFAACFDPRHSLIIYQSNIASFIEICITCGGISTSDNLNYLRQILDKQKWTDLLEFVKNYDIGNIVDNR